MGKCKYCGSTTRAGGSCSKSPSKYHVVEEDGHCIYCGSKTRAGGSCSKSPHKYHEVNNGSEFCIHCGSCSKSPTRSHVSGH